MRTDRDQRSDKELEIDDFLSQFDTPLDELDTDINSYLTEPTSTRYTAAHTFYDNSNTTSHFSDEIKESVSSSNSSGGDGGDDDGHGPKKRSKQPKEKLSKEEKRRLKKQKKAERKEKLRGASFKERFHALLESLFLVENPNYDPSMGPHAIVNGKKVKNKPMKVSIKKIIRDCIVVGCAMVVAFIIYAFVVISMAPKIDASDIYATVDQSSIIYDDSGNQVDTVFYDEDRELVKYSDCPEDLVNAFVALEDKTFWKHHGFNWTRMIGAVVQSVFGGGSISGTSTITQQLARNVYLSDTKSVRSIKRKVLEMYYATQIEHNLSKEEIIEAYMNTIYLGFGCYGIDAAAHTYYSKDVKDLSLVECASIAALPQAPDTYALIKYADASTVTENTANIITRDPETYIANDISKDRRDLCLKLMKDQGYINEEQYKANYGLDLISFIHPTIKDNANTYSYFHEYVVDEVIKDLQKKYDISYDDAEKMIYTQGLKIYSTLDATAQQTVVNEFNNPKNYPSLSGYATDGNGNIVTNGNINLYSYKTYFNDDESFTLSNSECRINDDGSVTVLRGNRLNIYTTEANGTTDYSLEFKQMYVREDGTFYNIPGGFISIPTEYKSLDKDDNLVIDAEFFKKNKAIYISGDTMVITRDGYTLQQKVIQPQSAMVITDVATGQIKAMVGGRMQKGQRLLNRCLTTRQPGSSIKPLAVYGAAIQKSYDLAKDNKAYSYTNFGYDKQGTKGYGNYLTASSVIVDEPMTVNGRQWPKNAGGGYSGTQTMRTALQQSINTCAVKIQLQVGTDYSIDMLKKFGLTTVVTSEDNKEANDENSAALALGGMTEGVTPLEMAEAYTAFPNGGVRHTATAYTKVVDRNGETILKAKSEKVKVMDPGVAWIMTDMLQSVVTKGIAGAAYVNNVQSGGKTGTTNDQYDIWFDGFTPTYAGSLWIGVDSNIPLTSMSGPAARLWGVIMRQIPKACSGTYKSKPSNVVSVNGEYYTSGTEKGRSTYIADEKKKKEEEEKKKQEEEQQQQQQAAKDAAQATVNKVDSYLKDHPEASWDEITKETGISKSDYDSAKALISEGGQ